MTAQTTILRNAESKAQFIALLLDAPLPLEIKIKPYKKARSLSFNSFYWVSVVTPLADHCGESPKETHRLLCGEYFGWVMKEFNGRSRETPRRTTTENEDGERDVLPWDQMSNFVEHSRSIAGMMGVVIPIIQGERTCKSKTASA
jgi:hypothetical protein